MSVLTPTVKVIEHMSVQCKEKYIAYEAPCCFVYGGTGVLTRETQGMRRVLDVQVNEFELLSVLSHGRMISSFAHVEG